jgi:hypothetical protein
MVKMLLFPFLFVSIYTLGSDAAVDLLSDINQISRMWGQISVYANNEDDAFGVDYVGLPAGCQVVRTYSVRQEYALTRHRSLLTRYNAMHRDFLSATMKMDLIMRVLQKRLPILRN